MLHSALGRELDSLADVISFGVAPAALAYAAGLDGGWDAAALIYFVCCGVSRLARFNVTAEALAAGSSSGKVAYFEGTPIPTSVVLTAVLAFAAWQDRIGTYTRSYELQVIRHGRFLHSDSCKRATKAVGSEATRHMSFERSDGYTAEARLFDRGLDQACRFCAFDESADVRRSDAVTTLGHAHADRFDQDPTIENSRPGSAGSPAIQERLGRGNYVGLPGLQHGLEFAETFGADQRSIL